MKIANREIGKGKKPYTIAEVGVNYDNSMEYAEKLIKAGKRAGADAIKFQTYEASKIVAIESPKYWNDDRPNETQYEFFERSNRFYHEETRQLARLCEENNITFLSTPFDLDSVDLLEELDVPAFKIASADITNHLLLRKTAKTGKPILLSTGAASIGEIEKAVDIIQNHQDNEEIVLMHCVLAYPTPYDSSNLRMIRCLKDIFPQYEVGWSDHVIPDNCITVPTVASLMGATVIEKHFTTDRTRKGNDHFHSADELLFSRMVKSLDIAHESLGRYLKQPLEIEENARVNARRSIAAARNISPGETFSDSNLILLRPGTGIRPEFFEFLMGKQAQSQVRKGHLLKWKHVFGDEN